ncbi:ATP-grasp fold amidoligase family protein [Cereibacter sphaeroides]|uniref:ATP-grasp fold amidoligase family protein n=1 Tax=Cereibacter sphaeroides TaxID=1063 RepID=UPI001F258D97|nr:ATP-grasp fold amidoligase family protein [Cereibacter sphaeroides]MCE6967056.1 hypothetical protein [Cereibacter sphaeroides]
MNKLKELTFPAIANMKSRIDALEKKLAIKKPPFYDQNKMFTYYLDREFSIEQKKWFIEKQSIRALGYFPNLDDPKSFNEKTHWYKLNYQDPLITKCIDKFTFKEHLASAVGHEYVVPLLGVWDNSRNIDFDTLPAKFVLKSNWGSGSRHVLIVKDKSTLNIDQTKLRLNSWIQPWENVYYHTFDWGYKDIPPKIIAEKLIDNKKKEYKFFCFDGNPVYFYVANDSTPGARNTHDYFDMNWNHLPFVRHSQRSASPVERPGNFDEMVSLCIALSKPFPHVRVDICDTEAGLLVEELTFYTGSGTGRFNPREWDYKFGEAFNLPSPRLIE